MSEQEQRIIFSRNLNWYLSKTELTQKEVANKIGVSPQTFNTWCQGIALPRMGKVQLLADFFRINKSDLIEDTSENIPQGYYLNEESKEAAQFLYDNPEYKILFDATRNVKPEDIDFVKKMIDKMNGND